MEIRDLGTLRAPLLAFGGAYSNLSATRALIDAAGALGIAPDCCLCTGDTVAYCAEPAEAVAALRAFGCPVVAGNAERQIAEDADDCGCGYDEGSACDRASGAWYAHARGRIDAEARAWMAGLPDMAVFTMGRLRGAVIHGGVTAINRFVWPSSPEDVFAEEVGAIRDAGGAVDLVIAGHSGIAFARDVAGVRWINAGAIGKPPHDGRPETRFTVLEEDATPTFRRLSYDHAAAARAMREAGLTQGYDRALKTGIWPSEDTLPPELRM